MTVLLIIIVVALFAITIWQLTKIFHLSRDSSTIDDSQIANNKDNKTQGYISLAFGIGFYLAMLYCFWEYTQLALPSASSKHGLEYDNLLLISMVIIMIVQVITQGLLYYFSFKYKGEKGRQALFFADNDKLEFIWTIIPVIVLSGLIIYGLFTWSDIMDVDEADNPLVIELYAKQFSWTARYSGEDNVLGKANVRFIEGANTLGVDVSDPYANDDKITREIHLPVGREVLFKFRSQDVLHSAYFPHFRAQMNVVPGMITQFGFTPIVTTEEIRETDYMIDKMATIHEIRKEENQKLLAAGEATLPEYENFDYYVLCNKICGVAHYNMQMKIVVESPEEYRAWLAEKETFEQAIIKPAEDAAKDEEPQKTNPLNNENVDQKKTPAEVKVDEVENKTKA